MLLCFASALLSALMSNTATASMLIPLAATLTASPSAVVLVAVSASFGIAFVISTPPNAMVYGEGGIKSGDLLAPGIVLMIPGCLLVGLTGTFVLNLLGIPWQVGARKHNGHLPRPSPHRRWTQDCLTSLRNDRDR